MSQALYDAQHGMSPEELWARYRQYPWRNLTGKMVMQGEPNYWQGPGLPSNLKQSQMDLNELGVTNVTPPYKRLPAGVEVNKTYARGQQLKTGNHELTHVMQLLNNLPVSPIVDNPQNADMRAYAASIGEGQARMVGNRSVMPERLRDVVHPYSQMYLSTSSDVQAPRNTLELLKEKYGDLFFATHPGATEADLQAKLQPLVDRVDYVQPRNLSNDMPEAQKQYSKVGRLSLMELLLQGRELYYPPFISEGLQK